MTNSEHALPLLYSFRRCPYAMRARVALAQANIHVELREVLLRDKPEAMLQLSPKGTVPVLQLRSGADKDTVIDESIEVMHWALKQRDPDAWLPTDATLSKQLIATNDGEFKAALDRYKYHTRHPEHPRKHYRAQGELFLKKLEDQLAEHGGYGLTRPAIGFADAAIFPFIRQFAGADPDWFAQAPYPRLRTWLESLINAELFLRVMKKRPAWKIGAEALIEDWL